MLPVLTVKKFAVFSVMYLLVAVLVASRVHPSGFGFVVDTFVIVQHYTKIVGKYLPSVAAIVLIPLLIRRAIWTRDRIFDLVLSVVGVLTFGFAFSLFKTSMPFIHPYWADAPFVALDRLLHFGADPWVATHKLATFINPAYVDAIYLHVWTLPAILGPMLLVLFDRDQNRIGRYLSLYCAVWIGLGNVFALAFLSVGPVYYGLLTGDASFDPLIHSLGAAGMDDARLGAVRDWLWKVYSGEVTGVGSGISAFPSVHVGVAAMAMFYLAERSRYLAPIGAVFLLIILFLSVYVGFHYAVDGYFSIAFVALFWLAQKRRQVFRRNGFAAQTIRVD